MVISVQFKDSNKNFRGKTYDYILNKDEEPPKKNSIIRMMDKNYNWVASGTRTRVVDIKEDEEVLNLSELQIIRYIESSMDGD